MDYNNKIRSADSIIKGTIEDFLTRAEQGKAKYGTNLDRTDLIDMDYLQHLKEELMDGVLYLNKFITIQKAIKEA